MSRHSATDHYAALALVFGLIGSLLSGLVNYSVLGALLGAITGVFIGIWIRQHDKAVEREYRKIWMRVFVLPAKRYGGALRKLP